MAIAILSPKSSPAKPSNRLIGDYEGSPAGGQHVAFCGGSRCYTSHLHAGVAPVITVSSVSFTRQGARIGDPQRRSLPDLTVASVLPRGTEESERRIVRRVA